MFCSIFILYEKHCPVTLAYLSNQGAGNAPQVFRLAFHHQGPTFISAYCQAGTNLV